MMPNGGGYGGNGGGNGYGPQAPYGPPQGGPSYGPPPGGAGGPGGRFNPMNRMPSFGQRGPGRPGRRQKGPYGSQDGHGRIQMPRRKLGKKRLAVLAVGAIFLIGGGFLIINTTISQNGGKGGKNGGGGDVSVGDNEKSPEQQAYDTATSDAQQLDLNGKYGEAAKSLKNYLATNPSTDLALQATIQLGATYLNARDYTNALIWYQKALDMSNTPERRLASVHGLALTYKWKGDNDNAIQQYKAAIAIAKTLPESSLSNRTQIDDTRTIIELGGTP